MSLASPRFAQGEGRLTKLSRSVTAELMHDTALPRSEEYMSRDEEMSRVGGRTDTTSEGSLAVGHGGGKVADTACEQRKGGSPG